MAPEELGLDKSSPYINVKLFDSFVLVYCSHVKSRQGLGPHQLQEVDRVIVVEIDVIYRTLFSDLGFKFTEDSKEYILVELDQ